MSQKIYLSGAIRGGRDLQPTYQEIYDLLRANGHTVLAHHVASKNVLEIEETMTDKEIYTQDVSWLMECDGVIAEVSIPSLGVGYEIGYALSLNKPILGVYESHRTISAMITGNNHSFFTLHSYNDIPDLLDKIGNFLNTL